MLSRGVEERPKLGNGPDGSGLMGLCSWSLGSFNRVAADEFVHDDGIAECFPEHCMQVSHRRDGEWLTVAASAGEQVAVQLGDRGRPHRLDGQMADARYDIEPDASAVVE